MGSPPSHLAARGQGGGADSGDHGRGRRRQVAARRGASRLGRQAGPPGSRHALLRGQRQARIRPRGRAAALEGGAPRNPAPGAGLARRARAALTGAARRAPGPGPCPVADRRLAAHPAVRCPLTSGARRRRTAPARDRRPPMVRPRDPLLAGLPATGALTGATVRARHGAPRGGAARAPAGRAADRGPRRRPSGRDRAASPRPHGHRGPRRQPGGEEARRGARRGALPRNGGEPAVRRGGGSRRILGPALDGPVAATGGHRTADPAAEGACGDRGPPGAALLRRAGVGKPRGNGWARLHLRGAGDGQLARRRAVGRGPRRALAAADRARASRRRVRLLPRQDPRGRVRPCGPGAQASPAPARGASARAVSRRRPRSGRSAAGCALRAGGLGGAGDRLRPPRRQGRAARLRERGGSGAAGSNAGPAPGRAAEQGARSARAGRPDGSRRPAGDREGLRHARGHRHLYPRLGAQRAARGAPERRRKRAIDGRRRRLRPLRRSGDGPCRGESDAGRAVRAPDGVLRARAACRLPPRSARRTDGTRPPTRP